MYRYIGNKTKLLPFIMQGTEEMIGKEGTVVDLMAGTGLVASEYRKRGYHVIASDMMTYTKWHLITLIMLDRAPKFDKIEIIQKIGSDRYSTVLDYLNCLKPVKGYFYQEFSPEGKPANGCESRKYFSSENACKIDAIRETLNKWIEADKITESEEAVLKHTLIMAVNKVANISGTYGYYLAEMKKNALEPLVLEPIKFYEGNTKYNRVIQGFAEEISHDLTADLCYIDPPYMKRQYAANYHILETIARGDYPTAVGKSGLRDWWDQHSKFCTKTKGLQSFEKVITEMNCDNFIISYSEDGLFSLEQLTGLLDKYGAVEVEYIDYNRFRSNQSKLPKKLNEYIIKLRKKKY
jgi:adenine-specific DNA-methyltransferase